MWRCAQLLMSRMRLPRQPLPSSPPRPLSLSLSLSLSLPLPASSAGYEAQRLASDEMRPSRQTKRSAHGRSRGPSESPL